VITGIFGRPYLRLERYLDLSALPAVHDEICLGLTQIPVDYTGGSHRSMGIVPPSLLDESWRDYGEVIRAMTDEEFATFRSLADDPRALDPERRDELEFGEERDVPLSRRQMLWLKVRFGVYFPWKVFVELIPNRYWGDKAKSEGKSFTRVAKTFFPKTIAFVQKLPFESIGRCNIMGLEANDFGTVHRDADPAVEEASPFITIAPVPGKRLFLWDEDARAKLPVEGTAYWFNDGDYHGVDPDPFFRYSLRVDGVFRPEFMEQLRRDHVA
jgi:hypothetical protein